MTPDDLSIPECLRREVTPENVTARARLVELDRNRAAGGHKLRHRPLSNEQATELRIQDEARRRWHSWIPTKESLHRPRLATFERLVREEFATKVKRRNSVMAEATTEAAPAAATKESVVVSKKTKSKARSAVKGKTAARAPAAEQGGVRPGSKLETVAKLLQHPNGCTTAEVLKATGWPSVSMPQMAKAAGLKLRKEKDGGVSRYWGEAA